MERIFETPLQIDFFTINQSKSLKTFNSDDFFTCINDIKVDKTNLALLCNYRISVNGFLTCIVSYLEQFLKKKKSYVGEFEAIV